MIAKQFQNDIQVHEWLSNQSNLEQLRIDYPPSLWTAKVDLENKCIIVESKTPTVEPYNDVPVDFNVDKMNF